MNKIERDYVLEGKIYAINDYIRFLITFNPPSPIAAHDFLAEIYLSQVANESQN